MEREKVTKVFIEMEKLQNLNSGLGQFCFHLGNAISQQVTKEVQPAFYVPKELNGIFGPKTDYLNYSIFHKFISIRSDSFSAWHCTHQGSTHLPSSKKIPLILTIHDLNFLEKNYSKTKSNYKLKALQKKIDRAHVITVISEYTGQVVKEHLNLKDKDVRIIYNGNSLKNFTDPLKPSFIPEGDFLFTIGIINAKKNFKSLLNLLSRDNQLNLIIAGINASEYAKEILTEASKKGLSEKVIMPGPVNDETKFWLFSNCKAFVFPSTAEGFGLPVIEAMSLGKPVFLTNGTSLPEIGGKEAYYWDSFDKKHMSDIYTQGMDEFENDPEKSKRIKRWAQQFSWDKAASEYINLYKEISAKAIL